MEGQNEQNMPMYLPITSWVISDNRITSTEKLMLVLMNRYQIYRANYKEFWDILGIPPGSARRNLRHLEQVGYIETVKNDGRGKIYRMVGGW